MLTTLRKECRAVWGTAPGDRFHSRYRRTRRQKGNGEVGPRVFRLVVAVICVAVALAFLLVPLVPSSPFFVASGALLASESPDFARLLDRSELRLRSWMRAMRKVWRAFPAVVKGILLVILLAGLIARIYLFYRLYHHGRG